MNFQQKSGDKKRIALYYIFLLILQEKNPDKYLNCNLKYGLSEKLASKNQCQLQNNVENYMSPI